MKIPSQGFNMVVYAARDLKSEGGENPEYDRALVEMVMTVGGFTDEDRDVVAAMLGIVSKDDSPQLFAFEQAALIGITTDREGNVRNMHVLTLDSPEVDAVFSTKDETENNDLKADVWEKAQAKRWAFAPLSNLPEGLTWEGV